MGGNTVKTLKTVFGLATLACAFALPAQAQQIDPGLWELQNEMQGGPLAGGKGDPRMAAMMEQLKNAPPEVRAMMEKQLGISGVGGGKDGGMKVSTRICLTPEDVKDDAFREGKTDGDCTMTKVSRSGNVWKGTMVCKGETNGTGEFTATLHSRQHYTTDAVLRTKEMGEMKMRSESRRISADCGNEGKSGVMGAIRKQRQ